MGQVTVYAAPPSRIGRLGELAYNLWWSWHDEAQALYRNIDPELWEQVNHNPVKFLRRVAQAALERAAADPAYTASYDAVLAAFDAYLAPAAGATWWSQRGAAADELIAYFSAEFGLHESLPIYSGGLGILSGDHCKAASDLGLPFVGVGFLYPQGYFQQRIDGEGRQQAIYEKMDFAEAPATPALGPDGRQVLISVDLPGRRVYAKVWRIQVGRIPLYLLDTDVEQNQPGDRELSARLYGGDQRIRISQEVVLGLGGVRALRALDIRPTVWHLNEGHAAFLQLERIREYVEGQGLSFAAALWAARGGAIFTTHTPVAAGNDAFNFELMDEFFRDYWPRLGLDREGFMNLGRFEHSWGPQFSMTALALRTAGASNGVSRLHGEVSRRMWRSLWPDVALSEVPIGHVTNGVHTDTWLHPRLAALYDRYLPADWRQRLDDRATWAGVHAIPAAELWAQHRAAKAEMLRVVRTRVARQLMREGASPAEVNATLEGLREDALIVGFARRFATYKRATLLLRDPARLQRILSDPQHPVRFIFAGKAHPADEPGKSFIQAVYRASRQPEYRGKIIFVEDYDAYIGRCLVAGVDVWLNNPRRPLEASGTSGQKAGLNGVLNFSVLDGWWVEGFDGRNGWAIGAEREYPNEAAQDEADALSLYSILESEIIPLFFQRNGDDVPVGWAQKMAAAIATVAPDYSLNRMLKEYVNRYYLPAAAWGHVLMADAGAGARRLADWEGRVRAGWPQVRLSAVGPSDGEMWVGRPLEVQATVSPGPLNSEDLAVELVYGRPAAEGLADARTLPLRFVGAVDGVLRYAGAFAVHESGRFAFGVRVRPQHPDLFEPLALGLVKWA